MKRYMYALIGLAIPSMLMGVLAMLLTRDVSVTINAIKIPELWAMGVVSGAFALIYPYKTN